MIILGINAYHADASAAILVNGKLIAATEEERFTRTKHWAGFPVQAIAFCLHEAGVALKDVDYICIGRDPKAKFNKKMAFMLQSPLAVLKYAVNRFGNAKKIKSIAQELQKVDATLSVEALEAKIQNVEHHRSHLASAFYPSPFEEAAILSIDGAGDFTTTMLARGKGTQIEVLEDVDFPHSVGVFYSAMTQLLGFPYYGDEYKVMGLAPYGEPKYVDELRDVVKLIPGGLFELNLSYFQSPHKGYVYYSDEQVGIRKYHADPDSADARRAEIILNGLSADVVKTVENGQTWYRVFSGPYDSQEAALAAQQTLQHSGIDSIVIKR